MPAPRYLRDLQEQIAYHLDAIARLFILRNDELADGDVVLSDDDLDKAIAAIRHLQTNPAHLLPADQAATRKEQPE